ncbi:hypothetical protein BH23GEM3_BH23GEM3_12370 [soil metagenome]|nr:MerC domain-containing protein [Gemmatimonadota bacterium]
MITSPLRGTPGWAAAVPVLCAAHCVAAPLLIVLAPALAPTKATELALIALTVVITGGFLTHSTRTHRRLAPWLVAAGGLGIWLASVLDLFQPIPEVATTVLGSLIVAGALIWNSRLLHPDICPSCSCPVCDERDDSGTSSKERPPPASYRE